MTLPRVPLALASLVAAASLAACSKAPEPVTGETNEARVAELERAVRDLKEERDSALRAAGADGVEKTSLGKAMLDLRDQMQAQRAKIEELEKRLASTGGAATASGDTTGTGGGTATPALPATFEPTSDGTFSEAQVATFGKLYDEMQRQRDETQQLERLRTELARAEVRLTPEQEAAVLRLQRDFAKKRNDAMRSARVDGSGSGDANELRTKVESLRAEFETSVRAAVPAAEADKIVEAMKKGYPGFFPRMRDGRDARRGN